MEKNYKVQVMAILNFNGQYSQVCLKEVTTENMEKDEFLKDIDIGYVKDFYVLDPTAKISVWITENKIEVQEEE